MSLVRLCITVVNMYVTADKRLEICNKNVNLTIRCYSFELLYITYLRLMFQHVVE